MASGAYMQISVRTPLRRPAPPVPSHAIILRAGPFGTRTSRDQAGPGCRRAVSTRADRGATREVAPEGHCLEGHGRSARIDSESTARAGVEFRLAARCGAVRLRHARTEGEEVRFMGRVRGRLLGRERGGGAGRAGLAFGYVGSRLELRLRAVRSQQA